MKVSAIVRREKLHGRIESSRYTPFIRALPSANQCALTPCTAGLSCTRQEDGSSGILMLFSSFYSSCHFGGFPSENVLWFSSCVRAQHLPGYASLCRCMCVCKSYCDKRCPVDIPLPFLSDMHIPGLHTVSVKEVISSVLQLLSWEVVMHQQP